MATQEDYHFHVEQDLKVGLEKVLKIKLGLVSIEPEKDFLETLRLGLTQNLRSNLGEIDKHNLLKKLRSLYKRLLTESSQYKTKILNQIETVNSKATKVDKIKHQIEILKKHVESFLSNEEFDMILDNRALITKTEFELNKLLMQEKAALSEVQNKQRDDCLLLEQEKSQLNQTLCLVEDYRIRFEGVLRNTKVKSNLRLRKGLEQLIRNAQKDQDIVQSRIRQQGIQTEVSEIDQNQNQIRKQVLSKKEAIDRIKKSESQQSFFEKEKTTLIGKKQILLEKTRQLLRVIREAESSEKQYVQSLCQHEYLARCKLFLSKLGLEIENKIHEYHISRIKRINDHIKRIWQYTYESRDITEVSIKLSDEGGRKKKCSFKKNFTYHLMGRFHGGRKRELKGRCSAGQKMMISVVIRLALAEAFCSRCKVISLDEPTTNLDKANANKLAMFLRSFLERDETQVKLTRTGST